MEPITGTPKLYLPAGVMKPWAAQVPSCRPAKDLGIQGVLLAYGRLSALVGGDFVQGHVGLPLGNLSPAS